MLDEAVAAALVERHQAGIRLGHREAQFGRAAFRGPALDRVQEHLPDAVKAFGVKKAWRFWSLSNPALHQATYEFTDQAALDQLVPMVQAELQRLARRYLGQERPGHLLQTSALVNEAFVRLIDGGAVQWQNRAQFFGITAQVMRRILVDHARRRST